MLEGLTVIDLSTVLAGPSVGTFLAELGASVIKVEHPVHKDVTRTWRIPGETGAVTSYFSSINYKKQYRSLDLKNSEDLDGLWNLLASADILLMNFKASDYESFGLSPESLKKAFPSLITATINGFGDESDRVAYDLILQAESGFMAMNGTPDSEPLKMPVALIDVLAAHHLFWDVPAEPNFQKTITELIYVPNEISDGNYILNLQVSNFANDAAPSRPMLFDLTEE